MALTSVLTWGSLLKSSVVTVAFLGIQKFINPIYSSPQCAARIVNESNPVGYAVHPVWKDYVYDDSCKGLTEDYARQQSDETAQFESVLVDWVTLGANLISALVIVRYLFKKHEGSSFFGKLIKLVFQQPFMFMLATVFLMHTHFMQDITYMTGAVLHHARGEELGLNLEKGAITQGYMLCGMANRILLTVGLYYIIKSDAKLSAFVNPAVACAFLQLWVFFAMMQVKKNHPWYHAFAEPGMDKGLPYTSVWRAFYHCIVHHDTGYSFAGDPFLDPLYDWFMDGFALLHNHILKIQFGSPAFYVFTTLADVAMNVMSIMIFYPVLKLPQLVFGRFFTSETESASSSKKRN